MGTKVDLVVSWLLLLTTLLTYGIFGLLVVVGIVAAIRAGGA